MTQASPSEGVPVVLATQQLGASHTWPQVVLAHGFTQNARCWGEFGYLLGETHGVVAVDAPGHGQSGHDDSDLSAAGRLIIEAGGPGHYLGYSMGGRMLLHGALNDRIGAVRSLVLIGATAGIDDDHQRAQRRVDDLALADSIVDLGTPAFIDRWLATPMFAALTNDQSSRAKRLENSAEGMAASLRHCGTGVQEPLWHALHRIEIPVLVLAGAADTKYCEIGERLAEAIGPNAHFHTVHGGHAVHLENPADTAHTVLRWIAALP